jgi:hypothetical protein
MSYETRAYDNHHGNPVVVLVATGTHDVSRLVNLLAGSRMALCEHGSVAHQIRRQVKRHNGGRAALKLLADHGGPDLLAVPDRELAAEVKRLAAEVERLRDVEKRMRELADVLVRDAGDDEATRDGLITELVERDDPEPHRHPEVARLTASMDVQHSIAHDIRQALERGPADD